MKRKKSSQFGGTFAEASIVLAMLCIFLIFLTGMFQMLTQALWLNQTTYQAALLGAETTQANRKSKAKDLIRTIENLQGFDTAHRASLIQRSPNVAVSESNGFFTTKIESPNKQLFPGGPTVNLHATTTAPILLIGSTLTSEPTFASSDSGGAAVGYTCCGDKAAGVGSSSCVDTSNRYLCSDSSKVGYYDNSVNTPLSKGKSFPFLRWPGKEDN